MQGALAIGGGGDREPLETEMSANFWVLDMMHPECIPSHDFEWELIRYYNRSQLDVVVIAGRPCMENGKPISWDAKELTRLSGRALKQPEIRLVMDACSTRHDSGLPHTLDVPRF